jgi:DNA-binding protein Fis
VDQLSSSHPQSNQRATSGTHSSRGLALHDPESTNICDKYSLEDIVEYKIARFLDQMGGFEHEHMHELIMTQVERPLLLQVLRRVGGNQVQAAKILGINRNTLRKKIQQLNLK